VAIVHARGPADSVLLMRRAERADDPWSGQWSFPGGRRDPSDPDLLHTALRELREECGVRLSRDHLEAEMPLRQARRKAAAPLPVTPFLFRAENQIQAVPDGREAVEASWIPLSLLRDPRRHRLMPAPGHPPTRLYPGVDLHHTPLWGFTHRLICDWLGLSPPPESAQRAGRNAAAEVLRRLASLGLAIDGDWAHRRDGDRIERVAKVVGRIPVSEVIENFSRPGPFAMAVSCLDVRENQIQLIGLSHEEHLIEALYK